MTSSHEALSPDTVQPMAAATVERREAERVRVVDIMDRADMALYPSLLTLLTAQALHPTSRHAAMDDDDLARHVQWGDRIARRVQRWREQEATGA